MAEKDPRGRMPLSLVAQEPELLFYIRQARERGGAVLVLGSANGRVAWALAAEGYSVLGVDPSESMVRTAEESRSSMPREVSERVRFLVADPRSLRLDERFEVVLAPRHALGLMGTREDLEAFLATVRHHLVPGGVFAYDVLNAPRVSRMARDGEELEPPEPVRPMFVRHLRERQRPGAPPGIHRMRLRHFSVEELDAAMQACGLTPRERYGRFDGKPFDSEDARHIGVADG